jgi:putative membrane protein
VFALDDQGHDAGHRAGELMIHWSDLVKTAAGLRSVWWIAGFMALYSLLAIWKENSRYSGIADIPGDVYAAFSLALGLLLVLRTNRAYERWWEARTLWGVLINVSRNLAIKVRVIINPDSAERDEFEREVVGFAFALKDHLRDGGALRNVPGWEHSAAGPEHVPLYLAECIYQRLADWKRQSRISDQELRILDVEARVLLDVCGGCERIRRTLIVKSYRSFAVKCLILYLVTLPWALVHDFQLWTIPLVIILTYIMTGLEAIAHSIEEPFGTDLDDLDLEGHCATVATSVRQALTTESHH